MPRRHALRLLTGLIASLITFGAVGCSHYQRGTDATLAFSTLYVAPVRDDAALVERSLASIAPHVSCCVIVDAGSTDGSADAARRFLEGKQVQVEVVKVPFENFGQARNAGLDACRGAAGLQLAARGEGIVRRLDRGLGGLALLIFTNGGG